MPSETKITINGFSSDYRNKVASAVKNNSFTSDDVQHEAIFKALDNLKCELIKEKGRCPVIDYVTELLNVVTFQETNTRMMAARIDSLEVVCSKIVKDSQKI